MKEGLLVIERIVLESISKSSKNIYEIENDTGLDNKILSNILSIFIMKNILNYRHGIYFLNMNTKDKWINEINSTENIQEEIKDIFISLVNRYYHEKNEDVGLKVKKVWLSSFDEKLLNAHLKNLDKFVRNIEKERRNKQIKTAKKLCEKKIIVWGHSTYSGIVDTILNAV